MRNKKARSQVFKQVEIPVIGRSVFPLSYSKKMTADMGIIYPVMCEEMVPGDHFKFGANFVIRMNPMLAPILHEIVAETFYFFVPTRLLWNEELGDTHSFEEFITMGPDGDATPTPPLWDPRGTENGNIIGTLWDYIGLPVGVSPKDCLPLDFPRRGYVEIWNQYFRDENLQDPLDITESGNCQLLNACWDKDYLTSSLLWQQRGVPPALPIGGITHAVFDSDVILESGANTETLQAAQLYTESSSPYYVKSSGGGVANSAMAPKVPVAGATNGGLDDNDVNLAAATSASVADLRTAVQLQKFMERSARGGNRLTEFLRTQYGMRPEDSRLQRPEFCGAISSKLITSEVLQTSQSTTSGTDASPQGNMAGHGICVNTEYAGSYFAKEFGYIYGLLVIRPRPAYQQGINKQWLRHTQIDWFNPLYSHLSERAVIKAEVMAVTAASPSTTTTNTDVFGFQGMYSEMRYKSDMVCGLMRTDLAHWHLGRIFEDVPALNEDFVKCVPDKRIFAVENEPGFIINWGNLITGIRPIPANATPGYLDHF